MWWYTLQKGVAWSSRHLAQSSVQYFATIIFSLLHYMSYMLYMSPKRDQSKVASARWSLSKATRISISTHKRRLVFTTSQQPLQWLTPLLTCHLTWQFPIVDGPSNLSWELVVTIVDGLADQGVMSILYGLAESYGWGSLTGWLRTVRDVLTPSYTDKLN
jgi:hypothetical protein